MDANNEIWKESGGRNSPESVGDLCWPVSCCERSRRACLTNGRSIMPVDRCIETHLLIALVPSLSFSSSSSSMQLVQQTAFLQVPSIKTMITLHANKQRVKLDNGSSIALNLLTIVAIQILGAISLAEAAEASTGEFNIDQQYQQTGGSGAAAATNRHAHPALLVDTKYWAKNMEFGEKDNWRWARKPCTLIERIAIEQQEAIVSLGDSMDALGGPLETNIRELIMAQDGILLLEEDTLASDPMDPMFVQFLNQTGDCYDSSSSAAAAEDGKHTELFEFEPNPNDISWFNPSNWLSAINQADGIDHLVPDSHRIPCSEDVVVFGDRHAAFWSLVEGNERAKIISFKVNFRPAEDEQNQLKLVNANSVLRVSKLKIGDKSYSQAEFDKLISLYGDNLFELTNNHSVFSIGQVFDNSFIDNKKILTIDESSIQANAENDLEVCLDEAGCLCGNEQFDVMQIICSFNEPIDESGLPCRDPIKVSGYCNKICATNMIIMIDPNRFSEPYLINELNKLNEAFGEHIFVGSRRVDYNRYEITLRSITTDENDYELNLGLELEFAKLIKGSLEKGEIYLQKFSLDNNMSHLKLADCWPLLIANVVLFLLKTINSGYKKLLWHQINWYQVELGLAPQ